MKRYFAILLLLASAAFGQVNYTPMPVPMMQFADPNGVPLSGGFVWTYAAGTTTPLPSYTDYTGSVMNSNPVVLDSAGRAAIFLGNTSYKFVVQNSASVQQWMVDGVASVGAVLAAPPAIGSVTPGPITATTILAQSSVNVTGINEYEVNGNPLNFTNLAGWPSAGVPCSTGAAWCSSYTTNGSGSVLLLQNSPMLISPNIGVAMGTSLQVSGALQGATVTDTGIVSAPVVSTTVGGQLQAATTTGTGTTVVLSVSPVFTGTPSTTTLNTATNCAVNSTSPAACGSSASGAFVLPASTTTYTVNTTAVTAHSRILLTVMGFSSDLPSSPTCYYPINGLLPVISAISAGTSFSIYTAASTNTTCYSYLIVD